jgi:ABC-type bacteriocin/lantibiotic exporter with double-glycine peptidase domain
LESTSRRGVTVVDPAAGRCRLSWEAVNDLYSGVAILLEPAKAFEPGGRAALGALHHARRLSTRSSGLGKVLATWVVVRLMALAVPVLTGVVVDRIAPAGDGHPLKVMAAVMPCSCASAQRAGASDCFQAIEPAPVTQVSYLRHAGHRPRLRVDIEPLAE